MKFIFLTIMLSVLMCSNSQTQTIPDTEFLWIKKEECIPKGMCREIFVKVENDPILTEFNSKEFNNLIRKTIEELDLKEEQSGTIKLKLLFALYQNLCISQIGTKSIKLTVSQLDEITNTLNSINQFEYGKQRNIEVNCQGILYIKIKNGKMVENRNVNFQFE